MLAGRGKKNSLGAGRWMMCVPMAVKVCSRKSVVENGRGKLSFVVPPFVDCSGGGAGQMKKIIIIISIYLIQTPPPPGNLKGCKTLTIFSCTPLTGKCNGFFNPINELVG